MLIQTTHPEVNMLVKLTREQLAARPDYVMLLQSLAVGEGGMASTADENTSKITLKNRLASAADAAKVTIKFHRSDATTVIFAVTSRETPPTGTSGAGAKRRGRKPKSAA